MKYVMSLLIILFSCRGSAEDGRTLTSSEYDDLKALTTELNVPSVHQKMMLVIPSRGCIGCIASALEFVKDHQGHPDLTVIVTGATKKFSTLLTRKYHLDPGKLVFENEGKFLKRGLITIYPTLFKEADDATVAVDLEAENAVTELQKTIL